jgi:hypothetical protein
MHPSKEQLNFFHTFGYTVFRQLFSPEETAWIRDELDTVLNTHGKGKDHDGSKRTIIVPTIDHSERLCTLLDDERILGIAGAILGEDFNYASGDGNYYSGDTGWHADGGYPELFAIKMAFYLDPLSRDTGCLRVIPGSHLPNSPWRQRDDMHPRQAQEQWNISPAEIPGDVAIETQPGDLAVFYHDTLHASFGGSTQRRMFTMNLTKRAKTDEELERVNTYLKHHCPVAHGFKIGGMYTETMLATANARRVTHLEQMHQRHALVHPDDTLDRPLPTF